MGRAYCDKNMCLPAALPGQRTLRDVVHYYSVGLLIISTFLFIIDMTTTILWIYPFGTGMFVGIMGIATGSMGISYANIQDNARFASALKSVMIMAWVTISFSFGIFWWLVVFVGGWVRYYYPYALVGELLCFMIQWGFLFYMINILGHPGACCALDSMNGALPLQQVNLGFVSPQNQPVVVQQPVLAQQQQQPVYQQVLPGQQRVMVYQQPNIQQIPTAPPVIHQGQQNPAARVE